MLQLAQVVLIQDFKDSFQVKIGDFTGCDSATLGNFAVKTDYPKCLQSKQLWNNMVLITGFGIGHALELQYFATKHSTWETQE